MRALAFLRLFLHPALAPRLHFLPDLRLLLRWQRIPFALKPRRELRLFFLAHRCKFLALRVAEGVPLLVGHALCLFSDVEKKHEPLFLTERAEHAAVAFRRHGLRKGNVRRDEWRPEDDAGESKAMNGEHRRISGFAD
ncbi:MAG: hypothetical protein JOZ55_04250 [Alphaproteobacteria bacterium]|nr:hypothetical protein [Alphaproteobacteria bacterium]